MESTNFTFIPKEWEVIEYLVKTAEDNIYQDPNTAMVKLRMLGETLTKAVFVMEGLVLPKGQYNRLILLKEKSIIPVDIYEKLELIREEGNTAVHNAGYGDIPSAIQLARYSFDLIVWFLSIYVDKNIVYPAYVTPIEQHTSNSEPKMSVEFEKAFNDKLLELEKELQRVKENNTSALQGSAPSEAQKKSKTTQQKKDPEKKKQSKSRIKIAAITIAAMLFLFFSINAVSAFATGKFMVASMDDYFLKSTMKVNGESFQVYAYKKAIDQEDTKRIESLLTLGVNPNTKSESGKLALNLSIEKNNRDLFNKLLTSGADPFLKEETGTSSIEVAVEKENLYFVEALLKDKNVSDLENGIVEKLSEANNTEMLRFFLESGMDPNLQLPKGETFLVHAIEENKMEVVKMLLDYGADPNLPTKSGKYPLHASVQKQNINLTTMLLESGASPNQMDGNKKYPIELAHEGNMKELESILLEYKSMTLFEIKLPSYAGFWKEKGETPERIIEINKDNAGAWYMVLQTGNKEEVIQIIPGAGAFTPVSDLEIKVSDGNFTKVTEEEFQDEKERLRTVEEAVVAQTQQSTSTTSPSSRSTNSTTTSTTQKVPEPSLLSKKMESLVGVWKRVSPLVNEAHGIRYIFVKKNNYGSVPSWRMNLVSEWSETAAGEYTITDESVELTSNTISSLKKPALATYTSKGFYKTHAVRGFIMTINSENSFNIQYLDHNDANILNEEFTRISENQMEERYLELYNIVMGR
ncbi:ankyrin repeat domain-containing protein [Fredinandcohnia sp. 179-A 10B2 NHS]|uniref:ankyrin repeat domain-containing protein n=1 Tax=Fredinandcohnia sp. 179-A 10B2 NHS TaxID=3235176 RepID=UPI00399F4F71